MKSLYGSYKTPVFQHWLSAWPTCRNHPIMRCPLRRWVVNKADNPKIPGCYREQCLPRDEEDKKDSSESEDVGDKRLFSPFQKESKEQPPWAAFCALRGSTTSTRDMKGLWTFYHAGLDTQLQSSRMLSAWNTTERLLEIWALVERRLPAKSPRWGGEHGPGEVSCMLQMLCFWILLPMGRQYGGEGSTHSMTRGWGQWEA